MLTMLEQRFTSETFVQQSTQEHFDEIHDALCCGESSSFGTPTMRPVIDVQIVFLERWRAFNLDVLSGFSGLVHVEAVSDLPVAQLPLEVACERIDPDAFDGLSVAMQSIELAATLRIAEVSPVGGLVAGAGKAWLLDEGFEQDRPIGVAGLPVIGQPSAHQGEDARGEVLAVHPRQDEEAALFTTRCRLRCR
jgi:hypothetical protein